VCFFVLCNRTGSTGSRAHHVTNWGGGLLKKESLSLRFPGEPQKHIGNSARFPPLDTQYDGIPRNFYSRSAISRSAAHLEGPGEARTILLLHIISVRPSKQPLMVRTFLKVYMELGSYFLFLQEQIKDIIIITDETPLLLW
jgi:hypothetical protein